MSRPASVPGQAALAGLVCVLDLFVSWDRARTAGTGGTVAILGYALAGFGLLLLCRRFPLPVLVALVAHSLTAWMLAGAYVPTLPVWMGLYMVASRCPLRVAVAGLALAFLPAAANTVDIVRNQPPQERVDGLIVAVVMGTLANLALFGVGRWVAWTVHQRREVARRAGLDAVAAERARIARDLHDVVAHSVTLMVLQTGGAARLLRTEPDRALTALRHVDDLGQQAIVELRRMLGLLDAGGGESGPDDVPIGLADVGRIVERFTTTDVPVRLTVVGEPAALEAGVELSAYRILQEALTNAARYADPREPVGLRVQWGASHVELAVTNFPRTVPPRAGLSTRHGLIGIRERAASAGGDCHVGTGEDGRFAVTVTLPLTTEHSDA